MKVLKFGGTSVGSAARMKDVAKLICDGEQKIVVLSAMSGTTNSLVEISDYFYKNNSAGAPGRINTLGQKKFEGISGRFHGVPVHSARLSTLERETEIAVRLEGAQRRWPSVAIGSYPQFDPSSVTITLDSRDIDALAACLASLRSSLGLMD